MTQRRSFERVGDSSAINLAIGQPSSDLLPQDLLSAGAAQFFDSSHADMLNYGAPSGELEFRRALAEFLSDKNKHAVSPDTLFLTGGSSQGLDLICARFTQPGDTVLVESASYFLAFQIFQDHGLRVIGIPTDQEGLRIDALEQAIEQHHAKLIYTIPSFGNPTGINLSAARRDAILELSRTHRIIVAADEAYQQLYFEAPPPPSFGSHSDLGQVVVLGTFSKILAPGLRVGWLQLSQPLLESMLDSGWINSGGAINQMGAMITEQVLVSGALDAHLSQLRAELSARAEAMDAALHHWLGDQAQWHKPAGGYFFWVKLLQGINTQDALPKAIHAGSGYLPGNICAASGGFHDYLRLSFAAYNRLQITEGIQRLSRALAD
jgi:2-aminoadipate transaminase